MTKTTKLIIAIIGVVTAILQTPAIQTQIIGLVAQHPSAASIIAALSSILALIHQPSKS